MTLLSITFIYLFIYPPLLKSTHSTYRTKCKSIIFTYFNKNKKSMGLTIDQYQKVNTPV